MKIKKTDVNTAIDMFIHTRLTYGQDWLTFYKYAGSLTKTKVPVISNMISSWFAIVFNIVCNTEQGDVTKAACEYMTGHRDELITSLQALGIEVTE